VYVPSSIASECPICSAISTGFTPSAKRSDAKLWPNPPYVAVEERTQIKLLIGAKLVRVEQTVDQFVENIRRERG
jgi:hypothetical protein